MTTTTDRRPSTETRRPAPSDPRGRRFAVIAAAALAVGVAIALAIAIFAGGGDSNTADAREATLIPVGEVAQTAPVQTDGAALERFDASLNVDPALGQIAPDVSASHFDGSDVNLSAGDGQARVLLFFAHWCPHCQDEVRSLVDWFDAAVLPGDIEVVAISTGVDDGAPNYPPSDWFVEESWPYPVIRDSAAGDLATAYGLSSFPYAVALNSDGEVVARTSGNLTPAQWDTLLFASLG